MIKNNNLENRFVLFHSYLDLRRMTHIEKISIYLHRKIKLFDTFSSENNSMPLGYSLFPLLEKSLKTALHQWKI